MLCPVHNLHGCVVFQLSVSPGGGSSDVQALASQPLPLRVDGVFEFSHRPHIHSVTVTATVKYTATPEVSGHTSPYHTFYLTHTVLCY